MKHKILQINTVANIAATGKISQEIGQEVIKNGWKSYIAAGRHVRESSSKLIKIDSFLNIIFHVIKTRITDRHGFGSKRATLKLIDDIIKIKPDIIHLHNLHGYYLNIELLFNYLKTVNIPIVWTLHDCWPFTGHCTYFDAIDCNRWQTGCYSCPQTKEYPTSVWHDNSERNYHDKKEIFTSVSNLTTVPVSNWLDGIIKKSFLKKYPQHIIFNGVNLNTFSPQKNNKLLKSNLKFQDKFIMLGVALNWEKRKGLSDFLALSKLIDNDSIIILVGLNKKQIKALPSNIIGFTRTKNVEELVEIYSLADVVLNLSVEETFGMTTIEGYACGTPAVVYNCTASPELVSSETGLIVEKNNIKALLIAINEIKVRGKAYYAEACRTYAVEFHNKDILYKKYILLYEKLLSKKK